MARRVVLGVRFARREALHGAWNHIRGHRSPSSSFCTAKVIISHLPIRCFLQREAWPCERVFANRLRWVKPGLLVLILASGALLCPTGGADFAARQTRRVHASYSGCNRRALKHRIRLRSHRFSPINLAGKKWLAPSGMSINHLRPEDKKRAAIFCQNYGEAGAIDFFGPKFGLPPAISGHQNYFLWGPRDWTGEVALVLDTRDDNEREQFALSGRFGPNREQPLGDAF